MRRGDSNDDDDAPTEWSWWSSQSDQSDTSATWSHMVHSIIGDIVTQTIVFEHFRSVSSFFLLDQVSWELSMVAAVTVGSTSLGMVAGQHLPSASRALSCGQSAVHCEHLLLRLHLLPASGWVKAAILRFRPLCFLDDRVKASAVSKTVHAVHRHTDTHSLTRIFSLVSSSARRQ